MQNNNGTQAALGRALAPWPALLLGTLGLRLAEWGSAGAIPPLWLQQLGDDARALLGLLPLWCLCMWPVLRWGSRSVQLWVPAAVGVLLLVFHAALLYYAQVAGQALGADLWAYRVDELRTTVAAAPWPSGVWWTGTCACAGLVLWDAARRQRPSAWALRPFVATAVVVLSLGQLALATWTLAANEPWHSHSRLGHWLGAQARWLWTPGGALQSAETDTDPLHPWARPETTPDTLGAWVKLDPQRPPHVLVLVIEGLGRDFSGPGARLGSFTPFLDRLGEQSLSWTHCLAPQGRTFAVLPSVLASLPMAAEAASRITHHALPNLLVAQGYEAHYYSGSQLSFDGQGDYLRSVGVTHWVSEADFQAPAQRLTAWGYPDGDLFERVARQAPEAHSAPRLSIVQTMSMHSPFVVPQAQRYAQLAQARIDALGLSPSARQAAQAQLAIYAAVLYTDAMLERLWQQLSSTAGWHNTLVIITGDHRLPELPMDSRIERHHVPLMVAGPLVQRPQRFEAMTSHLDIAPSVLALLAQHYGWATPATVAWRGHGLPTEKAWGIGTPVPLQVTKAGVSGMVQGGFLLESGRLYQLAEGLHEQEVTAGQEGVPTGAHRVLHHAQQRFASALQQAQRQGRLVPSDRHEVSVAYAAREHHRPRPSALTEGVVASGLQAHFDTQGRVHARGLFTQSPASPPTTFVPLLVLTDEQGRQLAEASAPARRLAAGAEHAEQLSLDPGPLPPGTYFASWVVSDPQTGRAIGQGQYHVAIRK